MRIKSFNEFIARSLKSIEVGFIVCYLLLAESVNIPGQISTIINLLGYLFIGITILRLWKKMAYVVSLDLSLMALILLAIFSVAWSANIDYSLRMMFGMVRSSLFAIYLATHFSFQNHLKICAWVSGWIVAINFFVYIAMPTFSLKISAEGDGQSNFFGIYTNKQMCGRIIAFSLITLIMYFRIYAKRRWLTALGILGAIFLLLMTRSSTHTISAVIALFIFPIYQIIKQGPKLRAVLLFSILLTSTVLASVVFANWEYLVISLGKGITFNGRTPIWELAIEQLMKRPILGYGYSGFWGSDAGWWVFSKIPWAVGENPLEIVDAKSFTAHNALLDLALQLGLLGAIMILFNLALVIYRAISLMAKTHSLESFWMFQVLLFQIVGSCFEPPIYLASNNIHWIIYVAMAYSSALLLHRMRHLSQTDPTVSLNYRASG
jgi:exopolysaccharide production protein ExoQ